MTSLLTFPSLPPPPSAVESRSVVDTSDQWGEPRELRWQLSLCLVTVWIMVVLALIKGVKPGEKVSAQTPEAGHQRDAARFLFYVSITMWNRIRCQKGFRQAILRIQNNITFYFCRYLGKSSHRV